jgi:hypothetical protein
MLIEEIIDIDAEGNVLHKTCGCADFRWDWLASVWRDRLGMEVRHMPHTCQQCGAVMWPDGVVQLLLPNS